MWGTAMPCRESRREIATLALAMTREIATAAPRNDEKGKGGHLRICPYIIRKKKEDAWTQPKKFFQLFLKKVLTKPFFHAILHIDGTDNTVNTVKTRWC